MPYSMEKNSSFVILSNKLLIAFLLWTCSLVAQPLKPILEIPVKAAQIQVDVLNNLYVVTTDNDVLKFSPEGKQLAQFNLSTLGNIGSIDVSDPLKILIIYPIFQKIIVTDNTLSEISRYSFTSFVPARIRLASTARSGGFWCYDESQSRLLKINPTFDAIVMSGNNLNIELGYVPLPSHLVEYHNKVYLNDTAKGILVSDVYGTYYRSYPFTQVQSFSVDQDVLWYFRKGELHGYQLKTLQDSLISLPTSLSVRDARIRNGRLYIISEKAVSLWAF